MCGRRGGRGNCPQDVLVEKTIIMKIHQKILLLHIITCVSVFSLLPILLYRGTIKCVFEILVTSLSVNMSLLLASFVWFLESVFTFPVRISEH